MKKLLLTLLFILGALPTAEAQSSLRIPCSRNAITVIAGLCFRDVTGANKNCLAPGTITCKTENYAEGSGPTALTSACTNTPAAIGATNYVKLTTTATEVNADYATYVITSNTANAADILLTCDTKHTMIATTANQPTIGSGGIAYDAVAAKGTCQAGSADASHPKIASSDTTGDSGYVGLKFSVLTGTGAPSYGCITANVSSTKILTLDRPLTATVDNTSTYDITPDVACKANVAEWNGASVATPVVSGKPLVSVDYGTGAGQVHLNASGDLAGAVPSVTGTVGSVASGGISAASFAADNPELGSSPGTGALSLPTMLRAVYQVFYHKLTDDRANQIMYKANGSSIMCQRTVSDNGSTYSRGACQ